MTSHIYFLLFVTCCYFPIVESYADGVWRSDLLSSPSFGGTSVGIHDYGIKFSQGSPNGFQSTEQFDTFQSDTLGNWNFTGPDGVGVVMGKILLIII